MAEIFTNPKLEALVEDRICGSFHNFCFQLLNMIDNVVRLFLKLKLFLEQTLWFPGRRKMLTTASAPFPSKSPFFKSCVCKRLGIWLTHFLEVEPSFFKITLNGKHITRVLTHRRQILRGNGRKGINMQLWFFTFSDFGEGVYQERH